jgi:hypothetical protein
MATNPLTVGELVTRAVQAGGATDYKALTEHIGEAIRALDEAYVILLRRLQLGASSEVELMKKTLRVAGSPERLADWIQTPVPALNSQTPYSLMHTEEGRKQVEDVLGRIEHGGY